MTHQSHSRLFTLVTVYTLLWISPIKGSVSVDDYTFYSITNGTGRTTVTGGSSLQVYGTGVGTDTADTQSVYTQFNSINLSVGESIRFEFTVRNFNHVGSSSSALRVAFADMPSSVGDVATLNPNWASGTPRNTYTLLVPVSGLTSAGAGNVLLREATNIQNPLAGSGIQFPTLASYALPNGSQSNKFSVIVTRESTNSVLINGAIGSVQFAQQSDTTNPFISFNTLQLGLRVYGSNNGFTVNDFNISSIPAWQTTYIGATNGTNNWLSGTNWITGARPNTNGLTVIFTNTANVSWTNATNTIGALLVSGGAVVLGSADSEVVNGLLLDAPSNAPVISNATDTIIHAAIEGTNGFTKLGDGSLVLDGVNSYTGTTTVNEGTLLIQSNGITATILAAGITVDFATTPVNGAYAILPGPLAANSLATTSITGLETNQTAFLTNTPNLAVIVSSASPNSYTTWASSFGLDPGVAVGTNAGAPIADPDSDGFDNGSEYAFGTIPNAPTRALLSTGIAAGDFAVSWNGPTDGVSYAVQTTTNLAITPFSDSGILIDTNVPGIMSFAVPVAGTEFYRVRATSP